MAEEEQEKKRTGIVRRILKWVGLGLLTLLLIAALFFQAPWKVTALLIVILLACTALPRPARKWFWLSVAVVIAALIIWVFLPDRNGDWRRYTFDDELAALQAKYAVPDEENAATIYNELLENYDANTFEPNLPDANDYRLGRSEPWSSKDYPELTEWLQQQEGTIAKLLEASKKEKCAFPINADPITLSEHVKILPPMRRWAFLLTIAANNDIAEGRAEQALEKCIALLQMAKHICQQPTIIDNLVGFALEALAIGEFNRLIVTGDVTEEQLDVIEEALAEIEHDWSSDLTRFSECEKLLLKNLWGMFYEVNPEGRTRLNRGSGLSFCGWLKCELPKRKAKRNYWRRKLTKAGTILGWFYMPSTPQKASEIIDAGYERLYAMAEPDFDWQKGTEKPTKMFRLNYRYLVEHLAGILKPAYHRIHDTYLRLIAGNRGSRLLVALRRYKDKTGQWPERLEDIKTPAAAKIFVDPINNSSFVYKVTEDSFKLYSKGKNNIDENGERHQGVLYKDRQKRRQLSDDWLIWPRKEGKTAKEKDDGEQQ